MSSWRLTHRLWEKMPWLVAASVSALAFACGDGAADLEEPVAEAPPATATPQVPATDPPPPVDADAAAPAAPLDLFALAVTYPAAAPTRSAANHHAGKGINNPENPRRTSCMDSRCHAGNSAPFAFGVTICGDARCTTFTEGAEVRVRGSDGVVFSAITDVDGNAWFYDNGKLKLPANVAIKKDAVVKTMRSPIEPGVNAGSCNMQGCHGANPQQPRNAPTDGGINIHLVLPK